MEEELKQREMLKQKLTCVVIKKIFKLKQQGYNPLEIIELMKKDSDLLRLLHNAQQKFLDKKQVGSFLIAKQFEERIKDF